MKPVIAEVSNEMEIVQTETFAPILYLIKYSGDVLNAIELQNNVKQGLSSAIMTTNLREAELFLSHQGPECERWCLLVDDFGDFVDNLVGGSTHAEGETSFSHLSLTVGVV